MSCYHPIPAVRLVSGDVSLSWHDRAAGSPLQLPCGSCVGCRSDKVLSWSLRCQHEAACWQDSIVVNLTYEDSKLPPLGQLRPKDLQLFLKRVRKFYSSSRIRFFAVGEYGEKTWRPHYHALLFNLLPSDLKTYSDEYYQSKTLTTLWGHGKVIVDHISPEACSYVAGYALKKIKRIDRREPRELVDPETGECAEYVPPFARMSNRPGIGALWYDKYHRDLMRGYVPHNGKKLQIPRYYKNKMQLDFPDQMEALSKAKTEMELMRMETDPTFWYRRSEKGREAAEAVAIAKKKLFTQPKTL